jgi:hypothetical protein
MTTPTGPVDPVPITPAHRRTWQTLWRRCSCGLPAPCVDRRTAVPPTAARTSPPVPPFAGAESRPAPPSPPSAAFPPPVPHAAPAARATAPASRDLRPPLVAPVDAPVRPLTTARRSPMGGPVRPADAAVPPHLSRGQHPPPVRRAVRPPRPAPWKKAEPRVRAFGSQAGRAGHLTPAQAHRTNPANRQSAPASRHRHEARAAAPPRVAGDVS